MRIGIDVRYLSHGIVGGVHTYVAQLVPALMDLAVDHQIILYADTKRPLEIRRIPPHVTVRYLSWRNPLSSVYNDFLMWRTMASDRLDVAHFPANYGFGPPGARAIITLHDAINLLPLREIIRGHPKTMRSAGMMTYLHFCTRAAVKRARLVLTVSHHAAREIVRHSGIVPDRIVPIHHAPTPDLRRIEDTTLLAAVKQRCVVSRPFVLADALKNPETVVRAWRRLPQGLRESRQIVFFARHPNVLPVVHQAVANGEARLLVRPSREDLIALYSMAEAFVFPSWIEGFGIPLLEAMTCGAPVVASNRGAIPEVVGDAALLADATDDVRLAQYLTAVLEDPNLTRQLRERGFARAKQFSWQRTAEQTLASYVQSVDG